jgi:hypothetical protein
MFSNTAYEAFYQYIGLALHSQFIKIITSQKIFLAVLLLIFGAMFFFTCVKFFSRYMPGTLIAKKAVPLSAFVKIVACLFLGISLLKVQSHTPVKKFTQVSWHTNNYIKKKIPKVDAEYEVSFIFDILTRSAEEVSRFLSIVIDNMFKKTNSQLESPSFFYKAIMLASSETIEDGDLRSKIDLYQDQCFEKALPFIEKFKDVDMLDRFFGNYPDVDEELKRYKIATAAGSAPVTCLDLKEEMRTNMVAYYFSKMGVQEAEAKKYLDPELMGGKTMANLWISQWLVNQQLEKREGFLGLEKGAEVPGTAGKVARYVSRVFSFDGLLHLFGLGDLSGIGTATARADEFANDLSRAPHIAGFVKMVLIMIFPFLVFFVVAGRWKVIAYWYMIYFSVLLWTPIWTLFYHIMTNIALSADVLQSFGKLHDMVSLYSSSLITARLYKMYSVYSWLQLLVGPLPTAFLAYVFSPMLRDSSNERAPEAIEDVKSVGTKAVSMM